MATDRRGGGEETDHQAYQARQHGEHPVSYTHLDVYKRQLTVSINQQPEALEVELPAYTLVGSRQVEIAWIDAYR